jgi:hypothetical protein
MNYLNENQENQENVRYLDNQSLHNLNDSEENEEALIEEISNRSLYDYRYNERESREPDELDDLSIIEELDELGEESDDNGNICLICYDIYVHSFILSCGHSLCGFCYKKISDEINFDKDYVNCPTCRKDTKKYMVLRNFNLDEISKAISKSYDSRYKKYQQKYPVITTEDTVKIDERIDIIKTNLAEIYKKKFNLKLNDIMSKIEEKLSNNFDKSFVIELRESITTNDLKKIKRIFNFRHIILLRNGYLDPIVSLKCELSFNFIINNNYDNDYLPDNYNSYEYDSSSLYMSSLNQDQVTLNRQQPPPINLNNNNIESETFTTLEVSETVSAIVSETVNILSDNDSISVYNRRNYETSSDNPLVTGNNGISNNRYNIARDNQSNHDYPDNRGRNYHF